MTCILKIGEPFQAVVRRSNMTTHSHQVDILQKALALIAIVTNYRLIWNISRKARTGISNTVIQLIMSNAGI